MSDSYSGNMRTDRWIVRALLLLLCASALHLGYTAYNRTTRTHDSQSPPAWLTTSNELASDASTAPFSVADEPLTLRPNPVPGAVDSEDVRDMVAALQPYFNLDKLAGRTPVGVSMHALRLWGPRAIFPVRVFGTEVTSGMDGGFMLSSLFNHREFVRNSTIGARALLVKSPYGIQALSNRDGVYHGNELQAHVGQLIAMAGDVGMASSFQVSTGDGSVGTIAEIVRDTSTRVTSTGELEWITIGLSRYASSGTRSWRNRFDQPCSFDAIASQLCDRPIGAGACAGTHVAYALTILLRADEEKNLLGTSGRLRATRYLQELSSGLEAAQTDDGAWNFSWAEKFPRGVRILVPPDYEDPLLQEIAVTGHHLEWMSLAPSELRPSDSTIRRAAGFLVRKWSRFVQENLATDWHVYNPSTHAARAIWLISGIPKTDRDFDSLNSLLDGV